MYELTGRLEDLFLPEELFIDPKARQRKLRPLGRG